MEAPNSVEAPPVPVNAEDLKDLPPLAIAALAARAAWRVLPATIDVGDEGLEAVTVALAVVGLAATGRQTDFSALYAASKVNIGGNIAAATAFSAAYSAAAASDGYVSSTVNMKVQATKDVAQAALDAISSSHTAITDDTTASYESIKQDFEWLQNWAVEKRAMDGLVGRDFFERPLWERGESREPPETWQRLIAEWSDSNGSGKLYWLVEMYHGMLHGKGPDWDQLNRFLDDWYVRYQEKEKKQTGVKSGTVKKQPKTKAGKPSAEPEEKAAPEPKPQPILLSGGIVTAAADLPAREDRLGRTPLVHTLADMLASPDQSLPMTIALLGDWGSGKSSVILQLKERLKLLAQRPRRSGYLFAEFNAWEYEQTDNIQAGLAQEVVRGLTAGLDWRDKLRLAVANASKQHGWDFYLTVSGLLLAGLLALLGVVNMDKLSDLNPMTQSVLGTGGAAVLLYTLLRTWQQTRRFLEHPLAEKLSTYLQLPNYGKHLGLVPVIKSEIKSLCAARLNENERLLVVVDDLDRCKPAYITETLDAIRLVMNLEKVAVIIAIDDRIAFRAVADHYRGLAEDGKRSKEEIARDYLGKIIQLPVNLYDPWPWEVSGFIKGHLFQVKEEDMGAPPERDGRVEDVSSQANVETDKQSELTPAARRLVEEHRLDPAGITGTGQNQRILKKDVERYLEVREQTAALSKEASQSEVVIQPMPERDSSTPESEQQVSDAEVDALMRDTGEELELFARLVSGMGFCNPRQLIRLRNSYRMLKGYRHSRSRGELDLGLVEELMYGLFWHEYLYQRKQKKRQLAELVVWEWGKHAEWETKAAAQEENPPAVMMARWVHKKLNKKTPWEVNYFTLMQTVEMVVLPNAEMGLMLTQAQADGVRGGLSTSDDYAIDPWA